MILFSTSKYSKKANKQTKNKTKGKKTKEKTPPNSITIELTFYKQLQYWTIRDIDICTQNITGVQIWI